MSTLHTTELIEVIAVVIVGMFAILGVFLALAKWIMYLTIKPIWGKFHTLERESKELREQNDKLRSGIELAAAQNRALVSQSMTEVVNQVAEVSKHYVTFQNELEQRFAAVNLDLVKSYITKKDLERELEICRKTTHVG